MLVPVNATGFTVPVTVKEVGLFTVTPDTLTPLPRLTVVTPVAKLVYWPRIPVEKLAPCAALAPVAETSVGVPVGCGGLLRISREAVKTWPRVATITGCGPSGASAGTLITAVMLALPFTVQAGAPNVITEPKLTSVELSHAVPMPLICTRSDVPPCFTADGLMPPIRPVRFALS